MFCQNCGQNIPEGTVFCPSCGQKQTEASGGASPPAPVYAAPPAQVLPRQEPAQPYQPAKSKKRHGCLTAFFIVLAVLLVGAAGVYFLLPGLSKPVDLGVKPTKAAYESALQKLDITKDKAPDSGNADDYAVTYGTPHNVGASLTSEELTSFFNENRPPYYAVQNVQVRVNDDGSIEASGTLDTSYVFDKMLGGQYSKQDAKAALPMLGLIPDKVNIYFKAEGSVSDNRVEGLSVDAVSVMGITIPASLIKQNMSFITNTLDSYISNECSRVGAYIDSVEVDNGQLSFAGSIPSSIERTPIG